MKHTIEFNLPEDQEDLEILMQARKYKYAIEEMFRVIRTFYKHSDRTPEQIDKLQDDLYDTFRMAGIEES